MINGDLPVHIHKYLTYKVDVRGNSNSEEQQDQVNMAGLFTFV